MRAVKKAPNAIAPELAKLTGTVHSGVIKDQCFYLIIFNHFNPRKKNLLSSL
jgi:hypothetical protein